MPQRIDKLTEAQEAKMPAHAEKWIGIGLSTEPANFEKAIEGAAECYKIIGNPRPYFCPVSSPYGAVIVGVIGTLVVQVIPEFGKDMMDFLSKRADDAYLPTFDDLIAEAGNGKKAKTELLTRTLSVIEIDEFDETLLNQLAASRPGSTMPAVREELLALRKTLTTAVRKKLSV